MTLRTHQTRWFEVFVRREQVIYALEALAGTHSVQLELDPRFSGSMNIEKLVQGVREFDRLADSLSNLLPDSAQDPARFSGPPDVLVDRVLQRMQQWHDRLVPLLGEVDELKSRRERLLLVEEAAIAMGDSADQLPRIAHATELLFKSLYRCAPDRVDSPVFEGFLEQSFRGEEHCFVTIACLPAQREDAVRLMSEFDCVEVEIPPDLAEGSGDQLADIRRRLDQVDGEMGRAEDRIRTLRSDPGVAEARANIETLRWFIGAAHQVGVKDASFCHITGWTSETDSERLKHVLQKSHVQAEVRFVRSPAGSKEPVATAAGWWRQPFQVFTAMSGALSPDEIDPTGLLAFVVPLLFGYMFPDTGHGLVIAIAGVVLSRYSFRARILISCGLASTLMGFLFDDFFGYRMLDQSWQIHALDNPGLVLVLPMFLGVALLLLGLIFNGIELYWRGQLRRWLLGDAAILLLYASALLSLLYLQALLAAAFAFLWYLVGASILGKGGLAARVAAAIGELAHSSLTLVLNTISFVRVGAFALAHNGLSLVVVTLTETVETPVLALLVFVVGHAMVIVLEGMVVFVQITRLMLFEFFIRFLRAEGRFFNPLS